MPEGVETPVAPPPPPIEGNTPETPLPEPKIPTPEREIPKSTLIEETRTVTHAAISRKAEQVVKSGNTSGYGENALGAIYLINVAHTNGAFTTPDGSLSMDSADTLKFARGDKSMEMTGITVNEDRTFRCSIQELNNPDSNQLATFTQEEIIDAIITSDSRTTNSVLNLLPEGQRELANLHIDILNNGENALTGKAPEQISQMIIKAGKESDLLTTNEMRPLANTMPETQRQQFLDLLEGRNLVTGEALNRFLQTTDINEAARSITLEINKLEKELEKNPNSEDIKEKIDTAREYLQRSNQALQRVKSGETQSYIDKIAKGQVDSNTARAMKNALINGDMDAAVELLDSELRPDPNDTPEQMAAKARRKREAVALAKRIGGMGLIALLLMAMVGSGLAKQATS